MTIRVDSTTISTVVTCTQCPFWYAFRWTRAEGWEAGAAHESRMHPDSLNARRSRTRYRSTHGHGQDVA